jgi:hypothetical protein
MPQQLGISRVVLSSMELKRGVKVCDVLPAEETTLILVQVAGGRGWP